MINIKEMPVSAQKAYEKRNKIRKVFLFIGWGLFVIALISDLVRTGDFMGSLLSAFGSGGMLLGIVHFEFYFKKMWKNGIGIALLLGIFALLAAALLVFVAALVGWIYLIADTVLFIMKKPLVYPFEHKYFLEMRKVQEEIEENIYRETIHSAESTAAAEQLSNLNRLKEQGAITDEEFNAKKAELLGKI